MTQRHSDDREHRRGLVLGLTMAEVLLLLLFLLLLALGARLSELQSDLSALDPIREAIAEKGGVKSEALTDLISELGELSSLRKANSRLSSEVSNFEALGVDSSMIDPVAALIERAKAIDPNDPIAALERALDSLESLRESLDGSDLEEAPVEKIAALAIEGYRVSQDADEKPGNNWPPIIRLSEADGHFFESGKAELQPEFLALISGTVIDQLTKITQEYDADLIEVIGHTDEQPIGPRLSNLDSVLIKVVRGSADASLLIPADNAGLGMARAAAVAKVFLTDPRLQGYRILPLSGAQVIDTDDRLTEGNVGDIKERRRIEIRVRRSSEALRPEPIAR
jgi:outer membrane protein OmpA-like peptidoglycan-associated protein